MEKRWLHWDPTPIKGVALSASGLLALADLSTAATRTKLTGTSSWLDTLVLVPGLHYQQSADGIGTNPPVQGTGNDNLGPIRPLVAHSNTNGQALKSTVTNEATAQYLRRVANSGHKGTPIILDINGRHGASTNSSPKASIFSFSPPINIFSHTSRLSRRSTLLYLLSAALTIVALVLVILTRDWWCLGMLCALMLSRILNIYIIRARVSSPPATPDTPNLQEMWSISLSSGQSICLRGLGHDLRALTTGEWMRAKTDFEGYLEAAAKLIVYLVAAFSGNRHQTGDIILLVLLLGSAGLLGLSNAHQSAFSMNGRVAKVISNKTPILRRSLSLAPERLMRGTLGKGGDLEKGAETTGTSTPLGVSHSM